MTEYEKVSGYYDRIRERVSAEDKLYNQRIVWLISMQAFLFATLGLILQSFLSDGVSRDSPLLVGSFVLIAVTGILVAMVSNRVISNGRAELNSLRDKWDNYTKDISSDILDEFPHPRGRHEKSERSNFWSRGISSGNLPHIFALVWLAFIVFLLFEYVLFA